MSRVLRIGVAFPGDPSQPATWSGTPSGVMRGLAEVGVEPIALNVEPPRLLRKAAGHVLSVRYLRPRRDVRAAVVQARAAARGTPAFTSLQSWAAPRALRRARHLDGIVQIGTGYTLATEVPVATFEDMTVLQTKTHPYLGWDLLSPRAFEARVESQRRAYAAAIACCLTSRWAADSAGRSKRRIARWRWRGSVAGALPPAMATSAATRLFRASRCVSITPLQSIAVFPVRLVARWGLCGRCGGVWIKLGERC